MNPAILGSKSPSIGFSITFISGHYSYLKAMGKTNYGFACVNSNLYLKQTATMDI